MRNSVITFFLVNFLFIPVLTSCYNLERIPIEYMQPGEITFKPNLQSVGVINNVAQHIEKIAPIQETSSFAMSEDKGIISLQADSKLATETLAEQIADMNYFETVVICDSTLHNNDTSYSPHILTVEEVNKLTQNLNVDFLIALEEITLTLENTLYEPYDFTDNYLLDTEVKAVLAFRIYTPQQNASPKYQVNDSMYWETEGVTIEEVLYYMPPMKQITEEASKLAGSIPAPYLVPHWEQTFRDLYNSGNTFLRHAIEYTRDNQWDKAAELWNKIYNKNKKKGYKIRAAMNMAVYCELKDQLDNAIKWVEIAQELAKEKEKPEISIQKSNYDYKKYPLYYHTSRYLKILKDRKKLQYKLEEQMYRFRDDF